MAQEIIEHSSCCTINDFKKLCRLCAACSDNFLDIYSPEGIARDLAKKMNNHLPIKVSPNDFLPLNCCLNCASTILAWHDLLVSCVEADKKLRTLYAECVNQTNDTKTTTDILDINVENKTNMGTNNSGLIVLCQESRDSTKNQYDRKQSFTYKLAKRPLNISQDNISQELFSLKYVSKYELGKIPNNFSGDNISDGSDVLFIELKEELEIQEESLKYRKPQIKIKDEKHPILSSLLTNNCEQVNNVSNCSQTSVKQLGNNGHSTLRGDMQVLDNSEICKINNSSLYVPEQKMLNNVLKEKKETELKKSDGDSADVTQTTENIQMLNNLEIYTYSNSSSPHARELKCSSENILGRRKEMAKPKVKWKKLQRMTVGKVKRPEVLNYNRKIKEKVVDSTSKSRRSVISKQEGANKFKKESERTASVIKSDLITNDIFNYTYSLPYVPEEEVDENPGKNYEVDFSESRSKAKCYKQTKLDHEALNSARVTVEGRVYYNCATCGKNLHSPYTYIWHMRIHSGEKPYVCDLCGKQFRVSQGLIRHLRETHEGVKNFSCDICGRKFATKRNVEEHRRIHTNERPYICDHCGKAFKQKASLYVHNRSHSDSFPFKCTYCDLRFRTRPPMMVHITRHTGEKPFPCEVCGRRFRIKYELKRHMLIHSDEKPFTCSECGLSFRQKRYLRNHNKINHNKKGV